MSSFLTIQQRVTRRIVDLPTAVSTEVPLLVNESIRTLMDLHNFWCMRAELQFNTNAAATNAHVIGQIPQGTSPWQWKEPRGNPYYVLGIGATREFGYASSRQQAYRSYDPFDPNSKGPPRMMLIGEPDNTTVADPSNPDVLSNNMNIEVYPYPDGQSDWTTSPAGEYRVNVPYWAFLPDLSADGDTNWFTQNAERFIVDFATARGFMMNYDEQRANFWYQQAMGPKFDGSDITSLGGWARLVIRKDSSISYAPGRVLIPRRDVFAPTDQWRT